MTKFVSVYRKDYLWPDRKVGFNRSALDCTIAVPQKLRSSFVHLSNKNERECGCDKNSDLKIEACPARETFKSSKNYSCLKQLLQKNPNLINVKQKSPTFNALGEFNSERLKTTYQVDYDEKKIEPDDNETVPDTNSTPCPQTETVTCPKNCRPRFNSRRALMIYRGMPVSIPKDPCKQKYKAVKRKRTDNENEFGHKKKASTAWISEYRDVYNRTGDYIMKEVRLSNKHRIIREKMKLLKPKECETDID